MQCDAGAKSKSSQSTSGRLPLSAGESVILVPNHSRVCSLFFSVLSAVCSLCSLRGPRLLLRFSLVWPVTGYRLGGRPVLCLSAPFSLSLTSTMSPKWLIPTRGCPNLRQTESLESRHCVDRGSTVRTTLPDEYLPQRCQKSAKTVGPMLS